MSGHRHNPNAGTQNQGNSLGDRSCVRQSKLYRMYESGNDVKAILGTAHLSWDPNQKQGAYQGHGVFDHTKDGYTKDRNARNENTRYENDYNSRGSDKLYGKSSKQTTLAEYGSRQRDDEDNYDNYRRQAPAQSYKQQDYDYGRENDYPARNNSRNNNSGGGMMSTYQAEYNQRNSGRDNEEGYGGRANKYDTNKYDAAREDCYPLNKMRSDDSSNFRMSGREQGSNALQNVRARSSEKTLERVAKSYFQPVNQQERSTRPW